MINLPRLYLDAFNATLCVVLWCLIIGFPFAPWTYILAFIAGAACFGGMMLTLAWTHEVAGKDAGVEEWERE